jgi:hypothetical protein
LDARGSKGPLATEPKRDGVHELLVERITLPGFGEYLVDQVQWALQSVFFPFLFMLDDHDDGDCLIG